MTYCQDPELRSAVHGGMQLCDVHTAEYLSYVKVLFSSSSSSFTIETTEASFPSMYGAECVFFFCEFAMLILMIQPVLKHSY